MIDFLSAQGQLIVPTKWCSCTFCILWWWTYGYNVPQCVTSLHNVLFCPLLIEFIEVDEFM
jgi:hypothetical protein